MRKINKYYSDTEIIESIKSNNDSVLEFIYRENYKTVLNLVVTNSGTKEDADDILQEGIIALYNKIITDDFILTSKLNTLLYSICNNLWLKALNKKSRTIRLDDKHIDLLSDVNDVISNEILTEKQRLIKKLFEKIGDGCKQILEAFYYDKKSMVEISNEMNFSGPDYVKTQKYRCIQKIKSIAEEIKLSIN